MLLRNANGVISLPNGLMVKFTCDWIEFSDEKQKPLNSDEKTDFSIEFDGFKVYNIDVINARITFELNEKETCKKENGCLYLDYDKIKNDFKEQRLYITNPKSGDRLQVFSDGKQKKINRIFIDQKIPAGERKNYPVLTAEDGTILALLGIRTNEKYKKTNISNNIMVVEYERI